MNLDIKGTTMTTIDDRKRALENKFAHDQELKFKAEGRRNRLFGTWAGERLGKTDIPAYVSDIIDIGISKDGEENVFAKVRTDFDTAGITATDEELRAKLTEFLSIGLEQVSGA